MKCYSEALYSDTPKKTYKEKRSDVHDYQSRKLLIHEEKYVSSIAFPGW